MPRLVRLVWCPWSPQQQQQQVVIVVYTVVLCALQGGPARVGTPFIGRVPHNLVLSTRVSNHKYWTPIRLISRQSPAQRQAYVLLGLGNLGGKLSFFLLTYRSIQTDWCCCRVKSTSLMDGDRHTVYRNLDSRLINRPALCTLDIWLALSKCAYKLIWSRRCIGIHVYSSSKLSKVT